MICLFFVIVRILIAEVLFKLHEILQGKATDNMIRYSL